MLGLYSRRPAAVCGVVQSAAGRSGFSWTAVCKQRTLWLQSQQGTVPCHIRYSSKGGVKGSNVVPL